MPFYSENLLAHELLHWVISQPNPFLLGRGLEEGICELLGSLYLSASVLGFEEARNIFVHRRLYFGSYEQFWEGYLDSARQAPYIYLQGGIDALLELDTQGRPAIKNAEDLILEGQPQSFTGQHAAETDRFTRLLMDLLLMYPRNFVVGPIAKFIANNLSQGDTPSDIASSTGIDRKLIDEALKELQERVFVLLYDRDSASVTYSDLREELADALKYELVSPRS